MSLIHDEHDRAKPAQYAADADLIDHAGPFCHAEPRVGGIILHFQRLDVHISGHYSVHNRGGTPIYYNPVDTA